MADEVAGANEVAGADEVAGANRAPDANKVDGASWADGANTSAAKETPAFAHAAEAKFARVLDFYKLEWVYEPRTFPLEWDEEGNVTSAFTPDFYLPQQDLYIELTTLRPSLHTFKNRKVRQLQTLYPEVNVKLLTRRGVRKLMRKYGLDQEAERLVGTDAQVRVQERSEHGNEEEAQDGIE